MALTFRRATSTDAPAIVALVAANDADLVTDYGSYVIRSQADIRDMIAAGTAEVIVADNSGVIVGANLFVQHPDQSWESLLTVTAPTLTDVQRLAGFKAMIRWVCSHAPNAVIWGRVRAGRRLDLAMQTTPFTRTDTGDGLITYRATAAVLLGVF